MSSLRSYGPYYDLIYSWKDYAKETKMIVKLIKKFKKSDGNTLLDVACGTGKHIEQLQKHCSGIDISKEMLITARKRLKSVPLRQGDMRSFDLKKKFDVITCLFSAIGHIHTTKDLEKMMRIFAQHLKPGGVILIEGWIDPPAYKPGKPGLNTFVSPDIKIARISLGCTQGRFSLIDLHYLIAEKGKPVQYFIDPLKLKLWTKTEVLKAMEKAGLRALVVQEELMEHRPLFIGMQW